MAGQCWLAGCSTFPLNDCIRFVRTVLLDGAPVLVVLVAVLNYGIASHRSHGWVVYNMGNKD